MKKNRKNHFYLITAFLIICNKGYTQDRNFKYDDSTTAVFNYFTTQYDSILSELGSVFLMPLDSLSLHGNNWYYTKTDTVTDQKEIYFKNRLLFRFETRNGEVDGIGYCFYPFLGTVALQGQFKHGVLNGLVFTQDESGKMIECMEFKNGIYRKHVFRFDSDNSIKSLKNISKNRSENPLRNDELIVHRTWRHE